MSVVVESKKVKIIADNIFLNFEGVLESNKNGVVEVLITRNDGTKFTYKGSEEDIVPIINE